MKVHVEAKPLHEPLAGGTPGTTVAVEPILAGAVTWSRSMMESPGGRFVTLKLLRALLSGQPEMTVPCPAFLIRHPSAGAILVDTGLHPSIATDGQENFGRMGARIGKPSLDAGADVPAQLRKRGLDAGEIPVVVMTHLHLDHSSAISEFPNSTFVVSEVEWKAATVGPRPLLNGYRRVHFDYAFDYRTIDFDRGGIDSYATFGRSFDLFGDGSIRLAFTPGHSAGHISVIARLKERDFVIGGDATYTAGQLEGNAPLAPRPFDAHNYRRSLQELKLFKREFPAAIVTPGHDPEFFARLDSRYE
ncbi:MAG TPA: N-acyl homoserine lactonase family protein [Solirubrobacterales bacterium]|nr:N-acyl homoserine lactonase family protein [Solirubrobacterales bacterium]